MFFSVLSAGVPSGAKNHAFLSTDNWDDWGKYRTQFYLRIADENGVVHDVGAVKIGQVGLLPATTVEPGQRAPEIPGAFDALDERFFSLGQGEDYYLSLNMLSETLRTNVLVGLRDIAFNLDILEKNLDQTVMYESLLRSVQLVNIRNRLNRITLGNATLTRFHFRYRLAAPEGIPAAEMDFDVVPGSIPPTNVHVLIGRNGVGKTQCMRGLAEALLARDTPGQSRGSIEQIADSFEGWSFAGLVLVSFSAFDDFDLRPHEADKVGSAQIGLRRQGHGQSGIKAPEELATDFRKSLTRCRSGLTAQRWREAVRTLETDDLFAEANVLSLLDLAAGPEWDERAEELFKRLSSGHAIILLTVTRLVELVDEKTLVLLDEPEGHLHPPLLSAFIRCLSDLLFKRNGVAIVATHSPVVLQEIPQSCAWKLRRSRDVSVVERPTVETFGENIGLLTREVFGLEVTRAGFHQILSRAVGEGRDYARTIEHFNGQLGSEARAIVQALIAERDEL